MASNCTERTRKLRSEAAKKRWSDPAFKKRVSKKIREAKKQGYSEDTLKRYSEAARKRWDNQEYREQRSKKTKEKWQEPEYRHHMSEVHKGLQAGEKHPMFGRKMSEAARKINSEVHKGKPSWMAGKTHNAETRKRLSVSHKGVPLSEKHRASIGKASKRVWARISAEKKNEWMGNIRKGLQCFPNKPESTILSILDSIYPNEWKFVGDGQVIICGKNPDFININGQKKIIELFGDYWHRGQNPQDRIDVFKPFGYDTLVIWERELKQIESVVDKIREFAEAA